MAHSRWPSATNPLHFGTFWRRIHPTRRGKYLQMTKEQRDNYLAEGLSVEQIAERIGRHPSTVTYWLKKHNLKPLGHDRHSPNGKVDPERLRRLIDAGATIREAAAELSVAYSTVRHWLKRLDLETETVRRRRDEKRARANGRLGVMRVCPKHGKTIYSTRSTRSRKGSRSAGTGRRDPGRNYAPRRTSARFCARIATPRLRHALPICPRGICR